ncbi:MAG: methionyl-tRNA formyltransferase [Chloroflexota bacterium]
MARPEGAPARRLRTVFFGSGAFAVPMLDALLRRAEIEIVGVITPPDGHASRAGVLTPVPVTLAARAADLPLIQVQRVRSTDAGDAIRDLAPDLGVLADFGQLIPQSVIDLPAHGIINVHPSLLPRHRGATPIPATILAGDHDAGVTIMQMDAGLDTGPIIAARSWPLTGTEDAPALEIQAAEAGAQLLNNVITTLLSGSLPTVPQDAACATLTRPLRRADGRLDPARAAAGLERQVRAYRPWPGAFVEAGGVRLAVHDSAVAPAADGDEPGRIVAHEDGIALTTSDGRLVLEIVQPAGGRSMQGSAFRRGRPSIVGAVVDPAMTLPSIGID